jgi:hypothetical protein
MEAEGARRQGWLDAQHDSAPRHQPVDARNFSIPENIETAPCKTTDARSRLRALTEFHGIANS